VQLGGLRRGPLRSARPARKSGKLLVPARRGLSRPVVANVGKPPERWNPTYARSAPAAGQTVGGRWTGQRIPAVPAVPVSRVWANRSSFGKDTPSSAAAPGRRASAHRRARSRTCALWTSPACQSPRRWTCVEAACIRPVSCARLPSRPALAAADRPRGRRVPPRCAGLDDGSCSRVAAAAATAGDGRGRSPPHGAGWPGWHVRAKSCAEDAPARPARWSASPSVARELALAEQRWPGGRSRSSSEAISVVFLRRRCVTPLSTSRASRLIYPQCAPPAQNTAPEH